VKRGGDEEEEEEEEEEKKGREELPRIACNDVTAKSRLE